MRLGVTARGLVHEDQTEVADLDLVAVGEDGRVDWLAVDIGSVEAGGVDDAEFAVFGAEFGVESEPTSTAPYSRCPSLLRFTAEPTGNRRMR